MTAAERRSPAILLGWLVPVVLVAAAVRILGLGNANLWGDEAFSVMTSLGPPSKLLGILATAEPHPPLYPFLLAIWLRLFGSSEFVARLPSAFFGIASVPVAAALARSFVGAWARGRVDAVATGDVSGVAVSPTRPRAATAAAVVAGLLVALSPFQVWYSQEARMYAQVSFFAGLATLALLRLWHGRRGAIPFYAVAILGAAGSHYYGLFIPLAHGVTVLIFARGNRRALAGWVRASALATLLYLPWVYVALRVFTSYYGGPPGSENLPQIAISAWARVTAGWSLPWSQAVTFAAILSVIAICGLILPARSPDDRFLRVALACWLFTPFVGGYVVSLVRPLYNERYLIVSSLPFILLMTRGIVGVGTGPHPLAPSPSEMERGDPDLPPLHLRWRGGERVRSLRLAVGTAAFVGALAVACVALHNFWIGAYLQSAYDTPVRTVDVLAQSGDAVILDGSSQEPLYQYYARQPLPLYTLPAQTPLDPATTAAELAEIARSHDGAWVFWYASTLYDPHDVIGRWLASNAYLSLDVYAVNARLQYYRFAPAANLTTRATSLTFGNALQLESYAWLDRSVPAGATVPVDLRWQRVSTALSPPRVALRLVDASGFTWAQTDQSIGNGYVADGDWSAGQTLDDRHGLQVPAGTPPGDYLLLLNAYDDAHHDALAPTGHGAPMTPGGVTLATIHVSTPSRSIWPGGIAGFHGSTTSFDGGIALLGWAGSGQVKAGESGYLTLFWKALAAAPTTSRLRLALLAGDGTVAEQRDLPLATSAYPPAQWRAGDVLREQYLLPIDARLAPGSYGVAILPLSTAAEAPSSAPPVTIGSVVVQPGAPVVTAAAPEHPLPFVLDGKIALSGFDVGTTSVRPGATVNLTLHWSDLAPIDGDYTVFVHVLTASSKVVTQRDQPPAAGRRPTSSWFPGDTVLDNYTLTLPATLSPGDYPIEVGMYSPTTGERLPVSQNGQPAGDRIILTHLEVTS